MTSQHADSSEALQPLEPRPTSSWVHRAWAGRRIVAYGGYGVVAFASYAAAYLLRMELTWPEEFAAIFWSSVPLLVVLRMAMARLFRLPVGQWRFVGTGDVVRLGFAVTLGSAAFVALTEMLGLPRVPRSVLLIDYVLCAYFTGALWLLYRTGVEQVIRFRSAARADAKRTLIVGAGDAGSLLAREMNRLPTGYRPIGFVDDHPAKRGGSLHGLKILGGTAQLRQLCEKHRIEELIIAIPSATPQQLRHLVGLCQSAEVSFKVLPGIAEVLSGHVSLQQLREVQIEDLLGREPIKLELPELNGDLSGRTVLITGAAGSIGSELARQVALYNPATLVLFDKAETELYYLELELRAQHPELTLAPRIGDVADPTTVEELFREFEPQRIFHAAAYKHVPMMELNVRQALRNNVTGTWRIAEAAGRYGAERFVLVSTDKAVRPSSVMGATKRMAELVVLQLHNRYRDTTYAAVRFGNVLGSNGSVIPIFKRQLAERRPFTVTHPDTTRYFMTIPEAVQLILQASLLQEVRGAVAMLEMGEPVKIVDLARNLLRLSGLQAGSDRIVFTGLRPGEKLHEELVAPDEETIATPIPKVRIIASHPGTVAWLDAHLAGWEHAVTQCEYDELLLRLPEAFPDLRMTMRVLAPARGGAQGGGHVPGGNGTGGSVAGAIGSNGTRTGVVPVRGNGAGHAGGNGRGYPDTESAQAPRRTRDSGATRSRS